LGQLDDFAPQQDISNDFVSADDWNGFVRNVLEITVEAHLRLQKRCIPLLTWEENTFTINLIDDIGYAIRKNRYSYFVRDQKFVYTQAMKEGKVSPNEAPKIDIAMYSWSLSTSDDIYFAWECKLIVDRARETKHDHLIREYVIDGMVRFVDGHWKYSGDVDEAGMLGYVLYGDTLDIVDAINTAILNPPQFRDEAALADDRYKWARQRAQTLSASDRLELCNPSPVEGTTIYQSNHKRDFNDRDILLYHIFLHFQFATENESEAVEATVADKP
jgi:hypothetical protein